MDVFPCYHNFTKTDSTSRCGFFSKSYAKCVKWKLDHEEYTIVGDTLIQMLPDRNRTYTSTDYQIRSDGGAWVCAPPELYVTAVDFDIMAIATWTTSTVFLILTIFLYLWTMSSSQHDTKPTICHMLSMVIFYTIFIIFQLTPHPSLSTCYVFCWIIYLSFRASFCWLNVVIFDMLRHFRPRSLHHPVTSSKRRFLWQSIYGWGVPVLIFGGGLVVKFMDGQPPKRIYKSRCLMVVFDDATQVTVTFVTLGIVVFLNILFYVLLVVNLHRIGDETKIVNSKIRRKLYQIYLKLMVLSSALWVWTIVEWAVFSSGKEHVLRSVSEVISGLQGVALFVLFICNTTFFKRLTGKWKGVRLSSVRSNQTRHRYQYWEHHM